MRDAPRPRPPFPPAVVRVREAAARLGVRPAVVRRWIQTGRLAGFRVPAGHYRVLVTALAARLDARATHDEPRHDEVARGDAGQPRRVARTGSTAATD